MGATKHASKSVHPLDKHISCLGGCASSARAGLPSARNSKARLGAHAEEHTFWHHKACVEKGAPFKRAHPMPRSAASIVSTHLPGACNPKGHFGARIEEHLLRCRLVCTEKCAFQTSVSHTRKVHQEQCVYGNAYLGADKNPANEAASTPERYARVQGGRHSRPPRLVLHACPSWVPHALPREGIVRAQWVLCTRPMGIPIPSMRSASHAEFIITISHLRNLRNIYVSQRL